MANLRRLASRGKCAGELSCWNTLELSYVLYLGKGSRERAYKVVCEVYVGQSREFGQGIEDSRVRQGVGQAEAERGDVL